MKKRKPLGTITERPDGKVDITIDMPEYKKYCKEMDELWEKTQKFLEDIGKLDPDEE